MAVNQRLFEPPKSPICSTCKGTGFICSKRIVIQSGKSIEYDYSQKCPACRPSQKEPQ